MAKAAQASEADRGSGDRAAAASAALVGLLSAAALLIGMLLMARLGGTSGRALGESASGLLFQEAAPLLVAAESVKLGSAAALSFVVLRTARAAEFNWLLLLTGLAAAMLGAAGGLVGFRAVFTQSASLGETTSALGFYGLAATGLWVVAMLVAKPVPLARWLTIAGLLFALACLAALLAAPLALLSVVVGWGWWFGLAARLHSGRN